MIIAILTIEPAAYGQRKGEKIDYQNMEKIARAIFATAWELANRPTRPRVDKPLPVE